MFIDQLQPYDASLKFQSNRLQRSLNEQQKDLYKFIDQYFYDYCTANDIGLERIISVREKFSSQYLKDLNRFSETGKYPHQFPDMNFALDRLEYDIILLSSFLLERPRFLIADWLAAQQYAGKTVAIGIGPGLELAILIEYLSSDIDIEAYDLEINPYISKRFGTAVKIRKFEVTDAKYDNILLIELLEHISRPEKFLSNIRHSLSDKGRLFLTTAVDFPQFDHLYNFVPGEIQSLLFECGMECNYFQSVEYTFLKNNVETKTELVIAQKKEGAQ